MAASKVKRKLLLLLELLTEYTDEEHPVSTEEICAFLEREGLSAQRKSVYDDIAVLRGCGFDVMAARVPKRGFFLAKRDFEFAEVRLLVDAVLTAPFITPKKTAQLLKKLRGLLSRYQAEDVIRQACTEQRVKFENEEIYYSIDAIHRAIAGQRKITFQYHHRVIVGDHVELNGGRSFTVSPYALLWANDRYYLAGNYEKYDTIVNYRIDRMKRVSVLPEKIRPFSEVSDYRDVFDTADYLKKSFHMFSGEQEQIELCCSNDMLEIVLDKFGNQVDVVYHDEDQFTVRAGVYVSDGLVDWILQHAGKIRVLTPQPLYERVVQKARELCAAYRIQP